MNEYIYTFNLRKTFEKTGSKHSTIILSQYVNLLNTSPIELLRSSSRWNWLYHAHILPNTHIWTQIWEDPCPAHIIYHTWTHKHVLPSASNSSVLMSLHSHIWKWVKQHFYFEAFLTFLMIPWITRYICSVSTIPGM